MLVRGCGCLVVYVLPLTASGGAVSRAFLLPLAAAQPDAHPTPVVDGPVRSPLPGLLVYVDTPELNLRAAPGTEAVVLAVLPKRTAVETRGHAERIGGFCCSRVGNSRKSCFSWKSEGKQPRTALDHVDELQPCRHEAQRARNAGRERREAVAQVLDQRMAAGQCVSNAPLLEATHRIQTLLAMPVVALNSVIQVARAPMRDAG